MHEEANRIYKHYLTTKLALEANSYLSQRHLSKDIIDYFEIGYAPEQNILLKAFENLVFQECKLMNQDLL